MPARNPSAKKSINHRPDHQHAGQGVVVDGTEGRLTAGGTEILSVDTSPSNGVIYTIDGVSLNQKVFDRDMD